MSYCEIADVRARAGRLAPAWDASTNPSETDIERFIDDVAAEIDQEISAQGFATPVTGQTADSLRGFNADGALVLALEATFPAQSGSAAAKEIHDAALNRFNAKLTALQSGKLPALAYLRATTTSAPGATSFWDEEPTYGQNIPPDGAAANPNLAPAIAKTDIF